MAQVPIDVKVDFSDPDDDPLTITLKGSTTGLFGGEEFILTAIPGDPAHDAGWGSQPFTNTLAGYTDVNYVWDGDADLGNGFNGTVYVRMFIDDGTVVVEKDLSEIIIINNKPGGAVTMALQRPDDGGIADITFNLIDADSNDVTVLIKGSDTGVFGGEEKVLTALDSDALHTLLTGTPLTATPGGVSYNFVWDAENEYANGFEGCIHLQVELDDGIEPAVVSYSALMLSVTYVDLVGDDGQKELDLWCTEDPALAFASTLTNPFRLGEVLRNARTSGLVLTEHQINALNNWRRDDVGLFNVGTQLKPFKFGDVLAELLGTPPFATVLTPEEIKELNDWSKNDASLARVSTLREPFKLGDVLNTLLTRRF